MQKIKVVTGYVPIAGHPRSATEYGELGDKLRGLKAPVQPFYEVVTSCWLYSLIEALPFAPVWAVGDNPQKNTLPYHIVQHQKFEWLYQAAQRDKDSDVFVWVDYGICHVPGVTPEVINTFLERLAKTKKREHRSYASIPGCWPIGQIDDSKPCWRFCGGLMVVPREYVQDLKNLVKAVTMLHVNVTKQVTWEVNTLARCEQTGKVPIRWYQADHNERMFTGF